MGREHAFDVLIDGVGYEVVRKDGVPMWEATPVPRIAGESAQIAEEERKYVSWHGGAGYDHFLYPNTYHYLTNMNGARPRVLEMGPLVTTFAAGDTVTDFFEQGSSFYVLATRYAKKINTSTDAVIEPPTPGDGDGNDFGAGAAGSRAIPFDSNTAVFFSTTTNAWTFSGTTWTQANTNNIQGVYGTTVWSDNANTFVLVRSYTASGDPAIAWLSQGATFDSTSWGPAYDIGDDTKPVTGMVATKTSVFVAKKDALYQFDGRTGRGFKVVVPQVIDDNNGTNLFVDSQGRVWYPCRDALWRYDPNTGECVNVFPLRGLGLSTAIYGRVTALDQYRGEMYAAVYNGTDSYIMVGREREQGESGFGPMVWDGARVKVTGASVSCMHVLGQTSPPRLFWGSGTNISYIRVGDLTPRYAASGSCYFPAENFGATGSKWNLAGIVCEARGFNASTYGNWYASLDGGDYQLMGRLQSSGRVFVPISADNWLFSNIAFRLDVTNNSNTTTPRLRGVTFLATRRVPTRPLIQTMLVCSERVASRQGNQIRRRGRSLYDYLDALSVVGAVDMKDWWDGTERTRRVLVQAPREMLSRVPGGKNDEVERAVSVSFVVQSSETVTVDAAPTVYKWNTGVKWNSGAKWG